MTANQFNSECSSRTINPEFALENVNIQQALQIRDDDYVLEILKNPKIPTKGNNIPKTNATIELTEASQNSAILVFSTGMRPISSGT